MPPPWKHQGFVGLGGGRACVPAEERVGFASLTPALLLEHYDVLGLFGVRRGWKESCVLGVLSVDQVPSLGMCLCLLAGREGRGTV